jgi:hypothetical protein
MITFLREYCDISFKDACDELGIDPRDLGDYTSASLSAQVYGPPNRTWQERAEQMVAKAQAVLRLAAGKDALEYLRARGFKDGTILDKGLGYIPMGPDGRWYSSSLDEWGLTASGTGKQRVWQPEGILIPWYVNGKLWKLDVRRLTGLKKDDPKILSITGSVDCLYNHDTVKGGKTAVICESALCAISGEQEAGDLAAFVATGGASKHRSSWAKHLDQATFTLISLDFDEPDENGKCPGDDGALYWESSLSYQARWHPYKKDINDMLVAGSNICEWVQDGTDWYYTLLDLASEKASVAQEPITEEIPIPSNPAIEYDNADTELCAVCIDLGRETPAALEYEELMYCAEHYPHTRKLEMFADSVQKGIPAFEGAKIEYWRKEDWPRMKERITHEYIAAMPQSAKPSSKLWDLINERERTGTLPEPELVIYPDFWSSLQKRLATPTIPSWLTPGTDDWDKLVARVGLKEVQERRHIALKPQKEAQVKVQALNGLLA